MGVRWPRRHGGILVDRIVIIGYHGFAVKDYDPFSLPHHLSLVARAPLVALAVVGMGVAVNFDLLSAHPSLTIAFIFALGYFSEDAFDVFRDKFRALLGKPASPRLSVKPALDGADLPLVAFLLSPAAGRLVGEEASVAIERLAGEGIEYTHDLVGQAKSRAGLEKLRDRCGIERGRLDKLTRLADVARIGEHVDIAAALVHAGVHTAEDIQDLEVGTLERAYAFLADVHPAEEEPSLPLGYPIFRRAFVDRDIDLEREASRLRKIADELIDTS